MVGDYRKKAGFLFFPRQIHRTKRWLEYAVWEEKLNYGAWGNFWCSTRWLDKDVEE